MRDLERIAFDILTNKSTVEEECKDMSQEDLGKLARLLGT
jgi:hypothetical protein